MERVVLYKDQDDHNELAFRVTVAECFNWGGFAICDLCNEQGEDYMYLCPELGHKALCEECFKEHRGRVKWYEEDKDIIIEDITSFMNDYGLEFNDGDLEIVNAFLASLNNK